MKLRNLIAALTIVFVVLLGGSAAVFAHPSAVTHPAIPAIVSTACSETGLTGSALQENKLFCNPVVVFYAPCTGVPDGGIVYTAAIGAANKHIMVGTPVLCTPSNDWSGLPIIYVEFNGGEFHAEYHGDNVVRIYNALNQQVYP